MAASFPGRRKWWIAFAAAALIALTLFASRTGGDDGALLRVGSQKGGTKALMLASGALKDAPYRIEWSEFAAAQPLLEAIGAGAVDIGLTGDAPFLFAYQSGSRVRAVNAQFPPSRPPEALAIIVPAGSPIRTVSDLAGKSIATTRGSVGHYLVLQILEQAKLPPSSVKLTFLAPGDAKAAFSSGSVDAWAIWAPFLTSALKEKGRIIADGDAFPDRYGFDVANESSIQNKRELITDFLEREAKALQWAQDHPADYAKVLARETGLPLDIARTMVDKNMRVSTPITDKIVADQVQVLKRFERAGALKGSRALNAGYDKSFSKK